jgi:hypothetical protein
MKRSEDELTDYKLVLHEPVAPYVVHSYNMLMHLVQGLVLAALFFVISEQEHFTLPLLCNLIICLGIMVSLWYNFLTNNQYGSAMRASVLNTLIPILLGVFQVGLALAITQSIYLFTLLMVPIFITVMIQLVDHINKHKNPQSLEIWKEHYKELGSQFAQDLFGELKRYEKDQLHKVFKLTISLGILTLFNYFFPLSLEIKTYISFIIVGIFIVLSVYFDLNHFFNDSEKLKKYGYKW